MTSRKRKRREMKNKMKITKNMTFAQVLEKYPETSDIFFREGMACIGCPMAMQETIEQGCKAHGINIDVMLEKLNKRVKTNNKK